MKFYDRLLFSCLLLGEQSSSFPGALKFWVTENQRSVSLKNLPVSSTA